MNGQKIAFCLLFVRTFIRNIMKIEEKYNKNKIKNRDNKPIESSYQLKSEYELKTGFQSQQQKAFSIHNKFIRRERKFGKWYENSRSSSRTHRTAMQCNVRARKKLKPR